MPINSRLRNNVLQSKSVHVTELDDASKARARKFTNIEYISSRRWKSISGYAFVFFIKKREEEGITLNLQ